MTEDMKKEILEKWNEWKYDVWESKTNAKQKLLYRV